MPASTTEDCNELFWEGSGEREDGEAENGPGEVEDVAETGGGVGEDVP